MCKLNTCLLYRFSITSHSTPLLFVPAGPVIPAISLPTLLLFGPTGHAIPTHVLNCKFTVYICLRVVCAKCIYKHKS